MEVITGKIAKPRRCVLYGPKGIGKSTWAAGAPTPIFIQAEEGLDDIGAARLPLLDSWDDEATENNLLGQFSWLLGVAAERGYRTLVVDSLDGIERLIFARVAKDKNVESIEDIPYQAGYKLALEYWGKFIDCMNYLRNELGMHIVLIAHAKVEKFEDPEQATWDKWNLQLHKNAAPMICQWADEVFFANQKAFVRTTKEGFGKEKARGVGTGERVLRTEERPSHTAKNRVAMPAEIPFPKVGGWDLYAEFVRKWHEAEQKAAATPAPAAEPKPKKAKTAVAS